MHKNDSKLSLCDICTLSICESLFWVTDPENHDTVEITYSFCLWRNIFKTSVTPFCQQLKAQQQRERMLDERLQSLQMLSEKVYDDI